jgi:hypothetical protein
LLPQARGENSRGFFPAGKTNYRYGRRQFAIGRQIVKRGNELAMGEIAGRTEDHDSARLGHGPYGKPFAQRIALRLLSWSIHARIEVSQISANCVSRKSAVA